MKTRQELILDFMLALAPNYLTIHGEACERWNESFGRTDEGRCDDCPTSAESVLDLAADLADEYLERM